MDALRDGHGCQVVTTRELCYTHLDKSATVLLRSSSADCLGHALWRRCRKLIDRERRCAMTAICINTLSLAHEAQDILLQTPAVEPESDEKAKKCSHQPEIVSLGQFQKGRHAVLPTRLQPT
ncbi:hypothetical protein KCU96_g76, partial [Aureobasidium melanogenum]